MKITLTSKSARDKLAPRREPYWSRIRAGVYVGFRRLEVGGTWVARRRASDGRQQYKALGSLEELDAAVTAATEWADALDEGVQHNNEATVSQACEHYVKHLRGSKGEASATDATYRFSKLVYASSEPGAKPRIGRIRLAELRTSDVKTWLEGQIGGTEGQDLRKARASANRNLASLRAALNLAALDQWVSSGAAWKRVKPFKDVNARREGFLNAGQRTTLVANCPADLALLVKGLLLTGARPGELAKATVAHFDKRAGTLALKGKTGPRTVILSNAAAAFFGAQVKDKIGDAPLLVTSYGLPWNRDRWKGPFREACDAAQLPVTTVMYSLRHAYISEAISSGVDAFSIAHLTGTSTAMIDKHYGHLCGDRMRARLDAVQMV